MITREFKQEHLLEATEWQSGGYLDTSLIDQRNSYRIESRPRVYGGCYVYQYITMLDGTIYELSSMTAATRGIVANSLYRKDVLQREVKQLTAKAINY
ncbi:hypothetical protein EC99P1_00050 [Enterococcus phage EC99P1]|nr:hypothetical protein EC99P1_00050 [Enterococcus phage EC99P1]